MAQTESNIIAAIDAFEPVNGNWLGLDELIADLGTRPSEAAVDALLRVFEHFPADDGAGVFWSIVHRLEAVPGYERRLIPAVRRAPSEFTLTMLNRLLNAGVTTVDGVSLLDVLRSVADDPAAPAAARAEAADLIAYQDEKRAGKA